MALRTAFIGAGRLGTALALALERAGVPVVAIASRRPEAAAALAARLPNARATSPESAVDAELVFLTVSDDQIAPLAHALPWRAGQRVVHCSGATELDALAGAAAHGAQVGGFHPLQIFSDPERAVDLLPGSAVAIEAEGPLEAELHGLAARLGMKPLRLPPGQRALYHGAASFAASFLLSLLHEATTLWQALGIAEADALQALLPLSRGTLDAAAAKGVAGAIAGPISRGDVGVVQRHLAALGALGEAHRAWYRQLSHSQVNLAEQAGRLTAQQAEALRRVLDA
jgi:predicted short-subunit dehydrogenase-like oxidoreductase (DUF2520 family)